MEGKFQLLSEMTPKGDQPQAIDALTRGLEEGKKFQTLLGVTGSGKTFTVANVIARVNRPTLVISHNKTLAAQLYSEFRSLFPNNSVEYFVSYYDYYQPEAYVPQTDTYIEKDSSVNDDLDRLRLSATSALLSRRDSIIVSSVSCIYNLGDPDEYRQQLVWVEKGKPVRRDELLSWFVGIHYERNDVEFARGHFRVRGQQIHDREGRDGLARPRFAHDAEHLARADLIRHAAHGTHGAGFAAEGHRQVVHLQQGRARGAARRRHEWVRTPALGSKASRRPSPTTLIASTSATRKPAGK